MGDSGGSSKKSNKKSNSETTSPVPGSTPMMTQPAFMPGNDTMLAQQLAAGGYGSVPDLMAMFQQTFTPMQVLNTQPGATPTPTTPTTPTTGTSNKPSWWRDEWGEYGNWQGQSGNRQGPIPNNWSANRGQR